MTQQFYSQGGVCIYICVYIHRIKRTEKSIYIESKELKNHARTKTHMCMLIPALFKTARKWEQEKDK